MEHDGRFQILGCTVPAGMLNQWNRYFVTEAEPYFLSSELLRWLPREVVVFTHDEFRALAFAPEHRDSYATFNVDNTVTHVALLTSEEVDGLSADGREALLRAQWRVGRGQVWDWDAMPAIECSAAWRTMAERRTVATEDGAKLVLDARLWWLLSEAERTMWLAHFIEIDAVSAVTARSSRHNWAVVERSQQPAVQSLGNTFAATSGPNCFSTTLAATTEHPATARAIAGVWLHQAPFLRGLQERGYQLDAHSTPAESTGGEVLLWRDAGGVLVHACYVIGDGLVLNKNAQSWAAPRQILALPDVLNMWREDAATVEVYRQAASLLGARR